MNRRELLTLAVGAAVVPALPVEKPWLHRVAIESRGGYLVPAEFVPQLMKMVSATRAQ